MWKKGCINETHTAGDVVDYFLVRKACGNGCTVSDTHNFYRVVLTSLRSMI